VQVQRVDEPNSSSADDTDLKRSRGHLSMTDRISLPLPRICADSRWFMDPGRIGDSGGCSTPDIARTVKFPTEVKDTVFTYGRRGANRFDPRSHGVVQVCGVSERRRGSRDSASSSVKCRRPRPRDTWSPTGTNISLSNRSVCSAPEHSLLMNLDA
jgi:hypothetical protein